MREQVQTKSLTKKQTYWLNHLTAATREGVTLPEYALRHGLKLKSLYNYRWQLRQQGIGIDETPQRNPFVKIKPAKPVTTPISPRMDVRLNWGSAG